MNKTFDTSNDLICPITLQLFRDPVLAGDGHVYEHEAITRWILYCTNMNIFRMKQKSLKK